MSRHGRAIMPFGKYRGTRIRLLPDSYLSWLTTFQPIYTAKWKWLFDSLIAELKYRGMRYDLAPTIDPMIEEESPPVNLNPKRAIRLERP